MHDFAGRSIFISGGASGIGLGVARAFADAGANVAIGDIDAEAAATAAEELQRYGVKAMATSLDVADPDSWAAAAQAAERSIGPISLVHSNAGVSCRQGETEAARRTENIDLAEWRWLMGVNLDGHLFALKTFLPRFRSSPDDEAHVILTASMAGLTPQTELCPGPYTVSKYATVGLAEHLRMELGPNSHIGLSVLCPGVVATNIGRNSAALTPGSHKIDPTKDVALDWGVGMNPDKLGRFVLNRVRAGAFYILTHPEYEPLVRRYHAEVLGAFGESAEPEYKDQVPRPKWIQS